MVFIGLTVKSIYALNLSIAFNQTGPKNEIWLLYVTGTVLNLEIQNGVGCNKMLTFN